MDKLQQFYNDKALMETVKLWFSQCADEWVLKELKDEKSGTGFLTAIKIINDSFIKLDEKYGKPKVGSKLNQSK